MNKLQMLILLVLMCAWSAVSAEAQSTNQSYPTAITANEIRGEIKARDIGDGRLTSYFYYFNATQGDIFVNCVTRNFNGDIDIFSADGAKSLSKIVIFADASDNETGRVIYLRKPEKLLLRIEGRSPNDDAASYSIKFAGSFQAINNVNESGEPKLPEVSAQTDSGIRVNSVGTIIETAPKPKPASPIAPVEETVAVAAKATKSSRSERRKKADKPKPASTEDEQSRGESNADTSVNPPPPDEETPVETAKPKSVKEKVDRNSETANVTEKVVVADTPAVKPAKRNRVKAPKPVKPKVEVSSQPAFLANVKLIVIFRDGTKIERPMTEISRVNVDDKGMLTVVSKDGAIGRYSIAEVTKFSIE